MKKLIVLMIATIALGITSCIGSGQVVAPESIEKEYQERVDSLKSEIQMSQNQLAQANAKNQKLNSVIFRLEAKGDSLRNVVAGKERQIDLMESNMDSTKKLVSYLRRIVSRKNQVISEEDEKIEKLKSRIEVKKFEVSDLKRANKKMNEKVSEANNEMEEANEKFKLFFPIGIVLVLVIVIWAGYDIFKS